MESLCQGIPCCVLSGGLHSARIWHVFCHAGVFSLSETCDERLSELIKYLRETSKVPTLAPRVFIDMSYLAGEICFPGEIVMARNNAYAIFISSPSGQEVVRKTPFFTPLRLIMNPWTPQELEQA